MRKLISLSIIITMLLSQMSFTQPHTIMLETVLYDNGVPVDGEKKVRLRLFEKDEEQKKVSIWEEIHPSVLFSSGICVIEAGTIDPEKNPLKTEYFEKEDAKFGIALYRTEGEEELLGQEADIPMITLPYTIIAEKALTAKTAESVFGLHVSTAGNIGIGLTEPQYKLDIEGSIQISSGGIYFADGTYLESALGFFSQSTTSYSGTGVLNTGSESSEQQPGISAGTLYPTTTETLGSGKAMLMGMAELQAGETGYDLLSFADSGQSLVCGGKLNIKKDGEQLYLEQSNADNGWKLTVSNADGYLRFKRRGGVGSPTDNTRFVITTAGNVGIGTTSPIDKFEVAGALHTSNHAMDARRSSAYVDYFDDTNSMRIVAIGNGTHPSMQFNLWKTDSWDASGEMITPLFIRNDGLYINGDVGIGTTTPSETLEVKGGNIKTSHGIIASTASFTTTSDYGLRVSSGVLLATSGGNVGIGIASPNQRLHVKGNAFVNGKLNIKNNSEQIYIQQSNSDNGWKLTVSNSDGYLKFIRRGEGDSPGENPRFTITTAGNVGIGTTNLGSYKLNVQGGSIKTSHGIIASTASFTTTSDYGLRVSSGVLLATSGGNVGIGIAGSGNHKANLIVNGAISRGGNLGGTSASTNINLGGSINTTTSDTDPSEVTISGGSDNEAKATGATIGGGSNNKVEGKYAVVGGGGGVTEGDGNTASGGYSTVSGGMRNEASGEGAVVNGGKNNTALGIGSTVAGGYNNIANGNYSTVGGGELNVSSAPYSWAGGRAIRLHSNAENTFAWGHFPSEDTPLEIKRSNAFLIFPYDDTGNGIEGNVGIGTAEPDYRLDVKGDIRLSGILYQGTTALVGSRWEETEDKTTIYKSNIKVAIGADSIATDYTFSVTGNQKVDGDLVVTATTTLQGKVLIQNSKVDISTCYFITSEGAANQVLKWSTTTAKVFWGLDKDTQLSTSTVQAMATENLSAGQVPYYSSTGVKFADTNIYYAESGDNQAIGIGTTPDPDTHVLYVNGILKVDAIDFTNDGLTDNLSSPYAQIHIATATGATSHYDEEDIQFILNDYYNEVLISTITHETKISNWDSAYNHSTTLDGDISSTNEIQTLSINENKITLSGDRSITVPYADNAGKLNNQSASYYMPAATDNWVNTTGDTITGILDINGQLRVASGDDAIKMGDIKIENTNEINNETSALYLQYRGNQNLILCNNSAKVGIGTTTPNNSLHVYKDYESNGSIGLNAATIVIDGNDDTWLGWATNGVTNFVAGHDDAGSNLNFWGHNGSKWNHVMSMTTEGTVGIGTIEPDSALTHELTVVSPQYPTVKIHASAATGNRQPRLQQQAEGQKYWMLGPKNSDGYANSYLIWHEDKGAVMTFLESGNVGIGTINPDAPLKIGDGIDVNSGYLYLNRDKWPHIGFQEAGTTVARIQGDNGKFQVTSANGATPYFVVDTTSGNVGIGAANPAHGKLQIKGDGTNNGGITFYQDSGTTAKSYLKADGNGDFNWYLTRAGEDQRGIVIDKDGKVGIGATSPGYQFVLESNNEYHQHMKTTGAPGDGWLFSVSDYGHFSIHEEGVGDKFVIKLGGDVGIGTIPDSKLHIKNTANAQHSVLTLDNTDDTGGYTSFAKFGTNGTYYGEFGANVGRVSDKYGVGIYAYPAYGIRFHTNGIDTPRMVIDSSGAVGIGTTTPGSRNLKVKGDIEATGKIYCSSINMGDEDYELYKQDIKSGTGITGGEDDELYGPTLNGVITITHQDYNSTQGDVTGLNNGTVIQGITLDEDGLGHIKGISSYNLDGRYYTETESNSQFLRRDKNTVQNNGYYIATDEIRARDEGGLKVYNNDSKGIFIQDGTGHVGIGAQNPGEALVVVGTISCTGINTGDGAFKLYGMKKDLEQGGGIEITGGGEEVLYGPDGDIKIEHADTSEQITINNQTGTVIEDLIFDTFGHVTALSSYNLDNRFLRLDDNTTQANSKYIETDKIRARDTDGLKVYNKNDKGIFVQDGVLGNVGIGIENPQYTLHVNGELKSETVNTGQGDYELYDMDQNVTTKSTVTFAAVNTGSIDTGTEYGPQELYGMHTDLLTPTTSGIIISGLGEDVLYGPDRDISIKHTDYNLVQGDIDESNGIVIQDITLDADGLGHIIGMGTYDLDGRYYTETESDDRFLRRSSNTVQNNGYYIATDEIRARPSDTSGIKIYNNDGAGIYIADETGDVKITGTPTHKAKLEIDGEIIKTGSIAYGNNKKTHINLGTDSETGKLASHYIACTVGGGSGNKSSHHAATVSGGENNTATGYTSTVSGGYGNTATGYASTVSGGQANEAGALYSWAGGKNMKLTVDAENTFIWGISDTAPAQAVGTNNAFLVFPYGTAGNMGIGTTNPTEKLDVAGDIKVVGDIHFTGDLYQNGFVFTGGAGSSPWGKVGNDIWYKSGSVGIGRDVPEYALDVLGMVRISSTTSVAGGLVFPDGSIMTSAGAMSTDSLASNTNVLAMADSDTNGTGEIQFNIGDEEKMVISNKGNIGIGITEPLEKLHIKGNIELDTSDKGVLLSNQDKQPQKGAMITWKRDVFGDGDYKSAGRWGIFMDQNSLHLGIPNFPTRKINFRAYNLDSSSEDLMTITHDGNVGIGITEPTSNLHIQKTAQDAGVKIEIENVSIYHLFADTLGGFAIEKDGIKKLYVNSEGNIGIGTTQANREFQVNGAIEAKEIYMNGDQVLTDEADPVFGVHAASNIADAGSGNVITETERTNIGVAFSSGTAAYSWGDHSTAGYLNVENDPDFASSAASDITNKNITTWNTASMNAAQALADASVAQATADIALSTGTVAYAWGDHSAEGYLKEVRTDDIENYMVTTIKIADEAITEDKLVADAVSESKIQNAAVTAGKLASGAVSTEKLVDSSITQNKIAAGAVSTLKIEDEAVTAVKIAANAVTGLHILNNVITNEKLASNAVETTKVKDNAITEVKIADNAVTETKISTGAVTTLKIADDAIITEKIQDYAVTNIKLAAGSVTNDKISSVEWDKITNVEELDPQVSISSTSTNVIAKWDGIALTEGSMYDREGKIGIGKSSPTYKLDVDGIVNATKFIGDGSALENIESGKWTDRGNDIWYTKGNVGIGTAETRHSLKIAHTNNESDYMKYGKNYEQTHPDNKGNMLLHNSFESTADNDIIYNAIDFSGIAVSTKKEMPTGRIVNFYSSKSNVVDGTSSGFSFLTTGYYDEEDRLADDKEFKSDTVLKNAMTIRGTRIGIGITNPRAQLDIKGNEGLYMRASDYMQGNKGWQIYQDEVTGDLIITEDKKDYNAQVLSISRAQKGITVQKDVQIKGDVKLEGMIESSKHGFKCPDGTVVTSTASFGGGVWEQPDDNIHYLNGNVGIGITNPQASLVVNGLIVANEVMTVADVPNWPDYVFKKGYKLMSLDDVEKYVHKENHLPGIPSVKEIEKDGLSLSEMDANLLKKIEELTLYTIEQQKMIEREKQMNKQQQKRLDEQDDRIKELEDQNNQLGVLQEVVIELQKKMRR